ncbi:hypothetical protein [Candidatus Leptofilum sp.]|uniref:sulfotransferase-like domain-containing protein n=1 Tax=Candidatus Leptofilum sp. TaxID=3241576 RepID=UPI003B5A5D35
MPVSSANLASPLPSDSNSIQEFAHLQSKHKQVYVIISPPRCSSTAFSRVFWEQPSIRYYSHEPFEVTYYDDEGLASVLEKLNKPLDLLNIERIQDSSGSSLLIKEMPYQVGKNFPILFELASKPIIFLIRDPRLNIASRIEKKRMVGESIFFPHIETGWELLQKKITYCERQAIPHMIVDSTDFRNHPNEMFPQIFAQFMLPFSADMLAWNPCEDAVNLDNLDGKHQHLYARVLNSNALQPATEAIPEIDEFPEEHDIREHVEFCLDIYKTLKGSPNRIRPQTLSVATT